MTAPPRRPRCMLFPAPRSSADQARESRPPTRVWRVSPGKEREMKESPPGSTATKKLTNMFRPPVWRKQTGSQGRTAVPGGRKGDYQSFLDSGTSFE